MIEKKYFVIGNPIEHSLSPKLHNHWINENKIRATYEKKQITESDLKRIIDEIKSLLDGGLSKNSHPFGGLVYRQVLEYLDGTRDELATRELIAKENRRYARRQLIWFRKEPNLQWISLAGEHPDALQQAVTVLQARLCRTVKC